MRHRQCSGFRATDELKAIRQTTELSQAITVFDNNPHCFWNAVLCLVSTRILCFCCRRVRHFVICVTVREKKMCRLRLNYREEGETDILPVRDWKEVQQTYKCFLNQDGDGDGLPAEVERRQRQTMSGSSDSYRASWLLIVTKTEFWVRQTQLASGGNPERKQTITSTERWEQYN